MNKKIYFTATLPYTNADPHIGTAFEFILSDIIVRYLRDKHGYQNVWFNLGADEHGLKMYQAALKQGISPKEYVDNFADNWKQFCDDFHISHNTFYRTSDPSHYQSAQKLWKYVEQKGDIYKKEYSGLYCVGCEAFKTEKELVDGLCPDHGKKPEEFSEENYFFRMSKYKEVLQSKIEKFSDELFPVHKKNEILNWVANVEDISISRVKEKLPWGIPVPGDDSQVMYVWFDALTNYISVLDTPDAFWNDSLPKLDTKGIKNWWPAVQIFGPDNLRFQVGVWQLMLLSLDMEMSAKFLNHGMILAADGTKMSKSKGNGVFPSDQKEKFGVEAVRLYMALGLQSFADASYIESDLINLYNSALADKLGNLLNRVVTIANKKNIILKDLQPTASFIETNNEYLNDFNTKMDEYNVYDAYQIALQLSSYGNEYISTEEPWSKETSKEKLDTVLGNLQLLLHTLIKMYSYVIPESIDKAQDMLNNQTQGILFVKIGVE